MNKRELFNRAGALGSITNPMVCIRGSDYWFVNARRRSGHLDCGTSPHQHVSSKGISIGWSGAAYCSRLTPYYGVVGSAGLLFSGAETACTSSLQNARGFESSGEKCQRIGKRLKDTADGFIPCHILPTVMFTPFQRNVFRDYTEIEIWSGHQGSEYVSAKIKINNLRKKDLSGVLHIMEDITQRTPKIPGTRNQFIPGQRKTPVESTYYAA